MITARAAAELIKSEVNLSWERDREKLFKLLTLVNNKAWKEGKWWGMNKHFHVEIKRDDGGQLYFIAPPGYNVLQAANFNSKPVFIRDHWFQFHKNGNGSIGSECCGGNWVNDVIDVGEVPVINQPIGSCVKIAARTTGMETEGVRILISGTDSDGMEINTHSKNDAGELETVKGAILAVDTNIRQIDNLLWGRIDSISKNVTRNVVEVYAIHPNGEMQILTRLQPEEKLSRLRKYLVPDTCGSACVHGIFKISKPEPITFETQKMIIEDEEALLSLSISMDYLFNKKAPEDSLPYTANGVSSLESDNREHQSPSASPVQVEGTQDYGFLEDSTY